MRLSLQRKLVIVLEVRISDNKEVVISEWESFTV